MQNLCTKVHNGIIHKTPKGEKHPMSISSNILINGLTKCALSVRWTVTRPRTGKKHWRTLQRRWPWKTMCSGGQAGRKRANTARVPWPGGHRVVELMRMGSSCQGLRGGRMRKLLFRGYGTSVWEDEKGLQGGGGWRWLESNLNVLPVSELYASKWLTC